MSEIIVYQQLTRIIWLLIAIILTLLFGSEIKRIVYQEVSNGTEGEAGAQEAGHQHTPATNNIRITPKVANAS